MVGITFLVVIKFDSYTVSFKNCVYKCLRQTSIQLFRQDACKSNRMFHLHTVVDCDAIVVDTVVQLNVLH